MNTPTLGGAAAPDMLGPVVVRSYRDEPAFVTDASTLATAGYRVAARAWTRRMTPAARQAAMLGLLALVLGAVAGVPLLYLAALVAFAVALIGRVRVLEVTYQK